MPEGTVYLSFIAFEGEVMALLLTPDGQVHTVDMDDVPALNQQVQAYRILLSYPTFYKQQQVQMFLWQGADQQVKAAAAAPEPGARRLEKPEDTDEGLQRLGELATHIRGGIAINDNREKYAWPNLPGTGKEVDEVAALFPPDTRQVYKKKQASEKVLRNLDRSGDLAGYKILLFATHGIFNPKVPELSALVLSQVGNQAPENGYITVSKWMGYNLRSDLVYLSACQTGLGKALDGEGIIGIPYALCIAGNQDTVMTLWETDDEKARAFSVSFFKKLRLGQGPVQALSATKREFLHGRGSDRNPNSWAAFLLYGI